MLFWKESNDIHSPSHLYEIDTTIESLNITPEQCNILRKKLFDLYWFIRDLE